MYQKLLSILVICVFAVMSLAAPALAKPGGTGNTQKSTVSNSGGKQSNPAQGDVKSGKGQPNADKEKPGTNGKQPDTDKVQLNTDEGQPNTDEEEPNTDEEQPDEEEPNFVPAPPVIKVDRVLVPVKSIERGLKATITWDEALNLVVIEKDGRQIQIDLTNKTALINDTVINLAQGKSSKARITLSAGKVKKLLRQVKVEEPVLSPVEAEKAKYAAAVTIDNTVAEGDDITALVMRLQEGQTADGTISAAVTAVNAADGTSPASYLAWNESNGAVTLGQTNTTGEPVTETATITFTREDAAATLVVTVTIQSISEPPISE